jgi:tetratricopeptide (TPR) repeat protein
MEIVNRNRDATPAAPRHAARSPWAVALALALLTLVAYHGSFSGPFIFDDRPAIEINESIRSLATALSPPTEGSAVTAHPILNLSFALNYQLGGLTVEGYHAINLLIHLGNGLLLFGLLRRLFASERLRARFGRDATALAGACAALWLVHPLLTESVTFVVQRTESLVSFFYLLTLYASVRAAESAAPRAWLATAIVACALGMGTKEVMVTAPLLVLLCDRTFLAGTFAAAWARRRALYLGLAASWLVLLSLVIRYSGVRSGSGGFDAASSPWTYLLTQCRAIPLYLKLSLWPHPLIVDYGTELVKRFTDVWLPFLALTGAVLATIVGVVRSAVWAVGAAWFFAILGPSSSVVPLPSQTMAEHRMYLPLVPLVIAAVLGLHRLAARRWLVGVLIAVVAGAGLTIARNHDYRSGEAIWRDAVAKLPGNWRAHHSLACMLPVQSPETVAELTTALRLKPDNVESLATLANTFNQTGRPAEAVALCETALRLRPHAFDARCNLGTALVLTGRPANALPHLEEALRQRPGDALAWLWLGAAHLGAGRFDAAIQASEQALRAQPDLPDAWVNLGSAQLQLGHTTEAVAAYRTALRHDPAAADAWCNLGTIHLNQQHLDEAIRHYTTAIRHRPNYVEAINNLGTALLRSGRPADAILRYREAVRLRPDYVDGWLNLGIAFAETGPPAEAIASYQTALRLRPGDSFATQQLARLRAASAAPPAAKP